ncbi:uncharacterized protein LOC132563760 [Ylistrum balloti]|uniref:uncharacterized protein LOC132561200 n=1 Tax=Ylistrum balloti TaxID=509963 RepID=UPI002905DDDB|nr:uncharacterized protein LOC132561200 [Ylistrum balloti]XP_060084492.1 uncharacterized protein LOC132563760 [Ylistrum balloti]
MVKHCCWGDCRSDDRYRNADHMQDVFFIPFPKPKTQHEKCRLWVSLCGRKNWGVTNVNKHTYICSKHFFGGNGPTIDHPNPLPASGTAIDIKRAQRRARPYPRSRSLPASVIKKCQIDDTKLIMQQENHNNSFSILSDHAYTIQPRGPGERGTQTDSVETRNFGTQTDLTINCLKNYDDQQLQNEGLIRRHLTVTNVTKDDSSCKFYTGLSMALLSLVFGWLKNKAKNMTYWCGAETNKDKVEVSNVGRPRSLSLWEEFLLALLRLRKGYDNTTLGQMFGISASSVSRIFFTWMCLMSRELRFLVCWPSREQCRRKLPKCFKWFTRTRCVIDCTEFFIQKPSMPSSQRITWSAYKHHNTLKVLMGITPTGSFSFVSGAFTGSISDKNIVLQSGFLEKIEYGDDIMADRGFLIRGELALRGATLNMPPFAMGRQLCSKATTKTRRIAHARIHVERAIGRLKNFSLLQGVLSLKLKNVIDDVILVCAALCNLDNQLVK